MSNNKLSRIEILLGNYNTIVVDANDIGKFNIKGLSYNIGRVGFNLIEGYHEAELIEIELNSRINTIGGFSVPKDDVKNTYTFDRLVNYPDIREIELTFEDNSVKIIKTPWGNSEYNADQTCYYTKDNLTIKIAKGDESDE